MTGGSYSIPQLGRLHPVEISRGEADQRYSTDSSETRTTTDATVVPPALSTRRQSPAAQKSM